MELSIDVPEYPEIIHPAVSPLMGWPPSVEALKRWSVERIWEYIGTYMETMVIYGTYMEIYDVQLRPWLLVIIGYFYGMRNIL